MKQNLSWSITNDGEVHYTDKLPIGREELADLQELIEEYPDEVWAQGIKISLKGSPVRLCSC